MFDKNIFAHRVKNLRKEKNVSQSELAKKINLTKNAISDIERTRRNTTIDKIYLMADFFDVSTDYLLGRTDNPNSHKN